ncbi:amidase [Loktanella sp. M215]|uniref:amidase n=1 Tax=Loktanella sp. M215 TaxID=2675431 RepID=UPI001F23E710|nr:amidase [Loktanella sp. M215]MCF7700910.1 amidase [Loktanella sp. M215]
MSALLKVQGLQSGYGRVPVLHGINLNVFEGEILGVLGHNGMGKSTLLKTLMGIVPATAGQVIFDGQDLIRTKASGRAREGIGYVPQGRGIFPNLSVRDNLRMGVAAHDVDETDAIDRVLASFPRLERLLDRDGGALSGGEQQLLALARCLISEPDLILLDEPTEGIQPSIIDEIIALLQDLNKQTGVTIVLVEQSLDFISALSDRVLLIQKGAIIGEVSGSEASNPELIDEFTGFGSSSGSTAKPAQPKRPGVSTPAAAPLAPSRGPAPVAPLIERMSYMTVQRPTLSQMKEVVSELGMSMSDARVQEFLDVMQPTLDAYDLVDSLPDYLPPVLYPRTSGYRPTAEENPMNAWYVRTEIKGAPRGPLVGRSVALKDNVCLAGVPMMNGSATLKGYTPDLDATVVTRLLDAGATIMGKAHCEAFCLSGGSHTNATGPVHNPHKHGYSAGGSSSGSGALVGAGQVDMAIGGDQGGSIRMPASFCGCYGMKPTHGLVPYSGIMPIETTIDHTGPLTQNVMDNALMLEVIAGADGLDPRQYDVKTDKYTAAVGRGVSGLRIGVIKEGFGQVGAEQDVNDKVRAAAETLRRLGAVVDEISVPWHLHGVAIWTPIALEGLTQQMMLGNGMGTGWEGLYTTSLLEFHSNWRTRADELSDSLKISMLIGQYHLKHTRGRYYAKAQNLSRQLRDEFNKVFASYDLLLTPTTPMKAPPLPPADASLELYIQRAFEMITNTAPFDVTGHPAMSVPCGMSDGLPVGLQIVGRRYDESTIYRAASAFEQAGDWRGM